MQTKYTKSFKIEAVRKYFNRSIGESYKEVADNLSISKTTLFGWVKQMKNEKVEDVANNDHIEKRPNDWSSSEKFEAILEVASMSEEKMNSYCRSKGIFSHHLQTWKEEFKSVKITSRKDKKESCALKAEIKALQKELRRKDKALAEAAALLVLKKKSTKFGEAKRSFNR